MKKLIFISTNRAKQEQLQFIVDHFKFPVKVTFDQKHRYKEVGLDSETIVRNGLDQLKLKIKGAFIIEDTSTEIEAFDGWPGVDAGKVLRERGREFVLNKMEAEKNRQASITSVVGIINQKGEQKIFKNIVNGKIAIIEKSGDYPVWIGARDHPLGGGYNPIFIPDSYDCTLAEISPEQALGWSYREKNFEEALRWFLAGKR